MPLPEDTILENRYRIDGLLAHGGMGAIYRAFDTNLNTPVAIKENFFQTPQAINQFKREALILARLRHPSLPRVTHHFSFEGQQYLVMDFVEGKNLWEIVKKQGRPLEENQAISYMVQVCEAVSYLHRQTPPIIHRDIKPQNIKITPDDRAILVDFGIAKESAPGSRTQTGAQGVTPGFSPPEQYSGLGTTPASDIYSLGATLYAVITGKKPPDSISLMVGGAKFKPPDEINVNVSHEVSQAIVHAMQVKPDDRPQSVTAWQKELEEVAKSSTLTSVTVPAQDKEETLVAASPSTLGPVQPPSPTSPPSTLPPSSAMPTPAPTPAPAKRSPLVIVLPMVIAAVILVGALAAAAYILYSSGVLPFPAATPVAVVQDETSLAETQTQTAEAIETETQLTAEAEAEMTSQAKVDAENTRQAEQNAATIEAGLTETVLAESVPTDTETPTPAPAPSAAEKPTATPTKAATSAKSTPTATPTKTATKASISTPVSAGPTLVPLKSDQSIDQIGTREVIDVDINLENPREVYVLVKADGIYKSTNGGDGPWARMNLDGSALTALVIDPHNPAQFYAPTWNAVLKSNDGGNSWKAFGNGLSTANQVVDVVTVDPVNPNLLYAGIGSTLVVSTDGGQNWTSDEYGNGLVGGRLTQIVVDPFNHDTVYVGGFFGSIYKSVDSGRNFIALAYGVGEGVFGMAAHPTQKDVYLAGINSYDAGIIKTENGGDFVSVSNGLTFGGADSAYSALVYAPSNPSIVYAGSGYEDDRFAKGIFKSTDGGKSWTKISRGLSINSATGQPHYVKSIAVHPTNPNIVLAATGGGLYKSTDGGSNWNLK
jgi:serine/threonine protein kinase/photosystem II stability/assembly factor-like uncharacterized protein